MEMDVTEVYRIRHASTLNHLIINCQKMQRWLVLNFLLFFILINSSETNVTEVTDYCKEKNHQAL